MKNIISGNIYLFGEPLSDVGNILPWNLVNDISKLFDGQHTSFSSVKDIENVVINDENGPVIIDSSAKIEPYTILNGPIYIGKNVLIKSHSNISNSIIEESCKIKGEVHSSIFQPFSMGRASFNCSNNICHFVTNTKTFWQIDFYNMSSEIS